MHIDTEIHSEKYILTELKMGGILREIMAGKPLVLESARNHIMGEIAYDSFIRLLKAGYLIKHQSANKIYYTHY
ncbi:hypothetical protein ACJU26_09720 [Acidithiobacillus sp. M4-SHS-6]|uniref:hypothetical protein n=1 Tax=Acidithiobacillus sp. M4-SHS-6 TaxID=3383024 RepID=UPI0039BDE62A